MDDVFEDLERHIVVWVLEHVGSGWNGAVGGLTMSFARGCMLLRVWPEPRRQLRAQRWVCCGLWVLLAVAESMRSACRDERKEHHKPHHTSGTSMRDNSRLEWRDAQRALEPRSSILPPRAPDGESIQKEV